MRLAILVEHGDAVGILFDTLRPRRSPELDPAGFLRTFQQRGMHVDTMDHRVGIAEALAEGLACGDATDDRFVERVVHDHVVGIDRAAARLVADAQCIEGMEGIGAELDPGADLADLRRLLQHLDAESLAHQCQCGGEAADAAAGDDDG